MKVYLSYSNRGYKGAPSQNTINLHKLCLYHLKKHYKEIYFLTDSSSKPFFKDLPWTGISTDLDCVPKDYPDVWSLSKIMAYDIISKKGDPFLHLDDDVILWKPLPEEIVNSDVFVQCPEIIENHKYEINKFIENCPYKSIFISTGFLRTSYNLGIFGGKDLDFISEYAKTSLDFIFNENNNYFWKEYKGYKEYWCKAVLAEQYFFTAFSIYKNKKISCLFSNWPSEQQCADKGYSHLMQVKNHPYMIEKIKILTNDINF